MIMLQFRRSFQNIEKELVRITDASQIGEDLLDPIRTMLQIIEAFEKGISVDQSRIVQRKLKLERSVHEHRMVPRVSDARGRHIDIKNQNKEDAF